MAGQVLLLGDDRFNFKLAGDNPSDPGGGFVRVPPHGEWLVAEPRPRPRS